MNYNKDEKLLQDLLMFSHSFFLYRFFVNESKISATAVQKHLKINSCSGKTYCIKILEYGLITNELRNFNYNESGKIWVCTQIIVVCHPQGYTAK
jgi:predicted DNA-binding transcriptional regulator